MTYAEQLDQQLTALGGREPIYWANELASAAIAFAVALPNERRAKFHSLRTVAVKYTRADSANADWLAK